MLNALENRKSWVTQRLANRYPPWSKVRSLVQSIGQQILFPAGRELEDCYWWSNYNVGNYILNTSDINQLEGVHRLFLPSNFQFQTTQHTDAVIYLTPTSVRGNTGSTWVTLSQAYNNSLEEFWYGVPTRVSSAEESYTYNSVLGSTLVSNLSIASPISPPIECKLWITLSNNGSSIKNYKGSTVRSQVTLVGKDAHGLDLEETIKFPYNGTIQTKNSWSEVSLVETHYVDETAYLRIDWLSVGQTEMIDPFGLNVTRDREKFIFYSLGSRSYGSTLKHMVFSADDLVLVQEGESSKHAEYEIELLNSSGSNIDALSLCPWPKRRWIVATDGTYLHFYLPQPRVESFEPIADGTTEAVVQAYLDKEWITKGDTITLDYTMKRPFVRVLRTRWSVEKPDGSRVCIAPDGSEIAYSSSGWVNHPEGTTFKKVGFQGDYIQYDISSHGRYVFYLESMITDLLDSEGQTRPIVHMDVKVVHSSYDTAKLTTALPISIGTAASVGFDSYHRPWVINTTGTAHRLDFVYDTYLADFQNKSIIVREPYTQLEVDA